MKSLTRTACAMVCFSLLLGPMTAAVLAAAPKRVLVLPFTVYAEKDLTFLQKGVEQMLSSRLYWEGKVEPVNQIKTQQAVDAAGGKIDQAKAMAMAGQLQADYVALGALTVFGESISTDARFFDAKTRQPLVTFNRTAQNPGEVIAHVDLFAGEVNAKVFDRQTAHYQPSPEQNAPTEQADDSRQHPEKLLDEQGLVQLGLGRELSPLLNIAGVWRSPKFKTHIVGMSVGDVDGDQQNETVYVSQRNVYVYRFSERRFEKLAEIPGGRKDTVIGVDTADVNGNGIEEIFVTNLHREDHRCRSYVLEWNGSDYIKLAEGENRYYRVIRIPGRGEVLLGQNRGIKDLFLGGVYELVWEHGHYATGEKLSIPSSQNIYGFTFGDPLDTGQQMIVGFDKDERLTIRSPEGREEWTSRDRYGGSPNYLEFYSKYFATKGPKDQSNNFAKFFIPQRVFVADADQDGKQDVLVVRNHDSTGRHLARLRYFSNGYIESLFGNQLGLSPRWRTQEISGYIADYGVDDIDNDGQPELVYAVSNQSVPLVGSERSYIVAQSLVPPQAEGEKSAQAQQ